jgi:hypothetical protein
MDFHIDIALFEDNTNYIDFDKLMNFVFEGKHSWHITSADFSNKDFQLWKNGLRPINQDLAKKIAMEGAYKPKNSMPNSIYIVPPPNTTGTNKTLLSKTNLKRLKPAEYLLKDAIFLLEQPLSIIVENGTSDGYFLNAIIKHFGNNNIKIAKSNNWIEYLHAGGKTLISSVIKNKINSFKSPTRYKLSPHKYLRFFVLFDSDKLYPTSPNLPAQNTIMEDCQKYGVPYHQLNKREIDNYLPDVVFNVPNTNVALIDVIDAFIRLNPEQKDFYDTEKGFDGKKNTTYRPNLSIFNLLPRRY